MPTTVVVVLVMALELRAFVVGIFTTYINVSMRVYIPCNW